MSVTSHRDAEAADRASRRRLHAGRALVAVVVVAVLALYLGPRIWNLTATPYRLDQAVVHADNYNPALHKIVEHEKVTLTAFTALESMRSSLDDVQKTDATVAAQLRKLIHQISVDLNTILDRAEGSVGDLVVSLNTLSGRINALQAPSDGASVAVADSRRTLQTILDDAHKTAADVHRARQSAESPAGDLSGK